MDTVMQWLQEFLVIYLVLMVMLQLSASEKYKKYIQFFSGILLLLFLLSPVLERSGKMDEVKANVFYETFWEQLDSIRQDEKALQFVNPDYYVHKYEQALENQIRQQAQALGIETEFISVTMETDYTITKAEIRMAGGEEAKLQMKKLLMQEYQLAEDQIQIL